MDYILSTEDLRKIVSKEDFSKNIPKIYPLNLLPKNINSERSFIVNSDISTGKGEHWVSIFFPLNSPPEFFDSLGKCPSSYSHFLLNFLIENSPKGFIYNYIRLQDKQSSNCGLFCIYFLYHRLKGFAFEEIMDKFSRNLKKNDIEVVCFYENLLTGKKF